MVCVVNSGTGGVISFTSGKGCGLLVRGRVHRPRRLLSPVLDTLGRGSPGCRLRRGSSRSWCRWCSGRERVLCIGISPFLIRIPRG